MHTGPLISPGLALLAWSLGLFGRNAPLILSLALIAAVGRTIQVGRARNWPKPAYVAFEIAVEAVRLLIVVVVIGLGDPQAGAHAIAAFVSGDGRGAALAHLASGWTHRWPQTLVALVLFAVVAVLANVTVFAIAAASPVRRLAIRVGIAGPDEGRATTAIVLFIKNLTIIPFTAVWIWGLLLFLSR